MCGGMKQSERALERQVVIVPSNALTNETPDGGALVPRDGAPSSVILVRPRSGRQRG